MEVTEVEYVGDHWELYDTLTSRQKERLKKLLERKQREKESMGLGSCLEEG